MKKYLILVLVIFTSSFCFASNFAFTSFSVIIREKIAIINFQTQGQGQNFILYRSTSKFTSISSLAEAVPIGYIGINQLPFFDYPIVGIQYYYAVIEENELASGKCNFIHGINTIHTPIQILTDVKNEKTVQKEHRQKRPIPIPLLNLTKKEKKKESFFSSQTENKIISLVSENEEYKNFKLSNITIEPFIFPDEKRQAQVGETMELQRILDETFNKKLWKEAEYALNEFLKIKRTSRTFARSRFYIGETLFFQKKYKQALLIFLSIDDLYKLKSQEWIKHCLSHLPY